MTELIAALGWAVASLTAGMWWGERGRRRDAQRREGVIHVDRPGRAEVFEPGSNETETQAVAFAEAKDRYIENAVAEGFSEADATSDWDRMMGQMNTEQPTPWQAK